MTPEEQAQEDARILAEHEAKHPAADPGIVFSEIFPNGFGPNEIYCLVRSLCAIADEIRALRESYEHHL